MSQYMATFGPIISTTGCFMPSTLRRDPRPEPRGQDQDPQPGGGRHQPGEDARPRDREGGSEGAAPQHYRDSSAASFVSSHCLPSHDCAICHQFNTHIPTLHHALADSDITVVHRSGETLSVPPAFQKQASIQ